MRFPPVTTLDALRRRAASQSLFRPTTLGRALQKLGFVQADPIRAPARAQDLVLRHRVSGYQAGDLERRYPTLKVQEEYFVNYGFVSSSLQGLMHPRPDSRVPAEGGRPWTPAQRRLAVRVLAFVRQHGDVHPREVEEAFSQGTVTNWWGGSSNATTHLLDAMLYRGMVRIVRREGGVRIFAVQRVGPAPANSAEQRARIDALADAAIRLYAPLPGSSLSSLLRRLRVAVPQWRGDLAAAIRRARTRLSHARVDGVDWYWPADGGRPASEPDDSVRLLSPFDPVVWDRARFALLWGWEYRFEGYTPASRRKRGYYALPVLWRDRVVGWSTISIQKGKLSAGFGWAGSAPRERTFTRELEAEVERIRLFLGL
jgi:uncharacterized protein YcaQ